MYPGNNVYPGTLVWNERYNGALRWLVAIAVEKYPNCGVIDVGANFGDTAAIAKVDADVPVFCIEGDPSVYSVLEQNARRLPGVRTRLALLGEREEQLPVVIEKKGFNLTLVPQQRADVNGATTVSITTLDACVADLPDADRYRVLKVDAEGFDCRILCGGMRYIERAHPIITLEYNRENMDAIGELGVPTLLALRDAGYRDLVYFDMSGRLLLATTLEEEALVRDLHDYADGRYSLIPFIDLCIFHRDDVDPAAEFVRQSRAHRLGSATCATPLR